MTDSSTTETDTPSPSSDLPARLAALETDLAALHKALGTIAADAEDGARTYAVPVLAQFKAIIDRYFAGMFSTHHPASPQGAPKQSAS